MTVRADCELVQHPAKSVRSRYLSGVIPDMPHSGSWSPEQAAAILARLHAGEPGNRLAAELGVSPMTISNLKARRTYKHLHRSTPTPRIASLPESATRQYSAARFWAAVDRTGGPNGCWPWLGTRLSNGYGTSGLQLPGRTTAFRIAYHLANGLESLPAGAVIRHLCGYKPCCNPGHLMAGTRRENFDDGPASPAPIPVTNPVTAPIRGWLIEEGDLALLKVQARGEDFWTRVDRSGGLDACWPWRLSGGPAGHASMRWFGRTTSTARIAWQLEHGEIPEGQVVRHNCDNGACCNPCHLRLGTQRDNRRDAQERGRIPQGEAHHYGRRTPDQVVMTARKRVAAGETMTAVARDLGVTITTVSRWVRGSTRGGAGGPAQPGP